MLILQQTITLSGLTRSVVRALATACRGPNGSFIRLEYRLPAGRYFNTPTPTFRSTVFCSSEATQYCIALQTETVRRVRNMLYSRPEALVAAGGLPAALQARTCDIFIQAKTECTHKVHTDQAGAYSIMARAKFLQGTHLPITMYAQCGPVQSSH